MSQLRETNGEIDKIKAKVYGNSLFVDTCNEAENYFKNYWANKIVNQTIFNTQSINNNDILQLIQNTKANLWNYCYFKVKSLSHLIKQKINK